MGAADSAQANNPTVAMAQRWRAADRRGLPGFLHPLEALVQAGDARDRIASDQYTSAVAALGVFAAIGGHMANIQTTTPATPAPE